MLFPDSPIFFYLRLFNPVTKKKLFLSRKNIGGAFAPNLARQSYTDAYKFKVFHLHSMISYGE
jgi:hypothetical protein